MIGLIIGGTLGTLVMSCIQIHRINAYEAEIQSLKKDQNTKK